ncbi:MAG: hypothetical protein JXR96_18085 [Deltaproteobacteria bacterium]|nr:hypothetical protein [Deltaproteobacteria bacterium]
MRITPEHAAKAVSDAAGEPVDPEHIHLMEPSELPGTIVVSQHWTTHSAILRGVFVDGEFGSAEDQLGKALARAGWAEADETQRGKLALAWVEHVLYGYSGHVLREASHVFGKKGRPKFSPPATAARADGSIRVSLWLREVEAGKSGTKAFWQAEVVVASDGGALTARSLHRFEVSNRELFRR